ncbi:hypothetical protein QRX49_06760, partial [Staphylococcus aureus]
GSFISRYLTFESFNLYFGLQISLTEQGKAIKSPLAEISVKVFNEFNISEREASDIINNLQNFVSKNFDYSDRK